MDQRALVERAKRGDHDAFAGARRPGARAAGRGSPADPPRPGARARRGPGGAHQGLARPAGTPRSRPVRCLASPSDRQCLPRYRPPSKAPRRSRSSSLRSITCGVRRLGASPTAAGRFRRSGALTLVTRGRRPALPPRDAAARGGDIPWHPVGTAKSRLHSRSPRCGCRSRPTRSGPGRSGRAGRMTSEDRFDRQLPAVLEDLYLGPQSRTIATRSLGRPPCARASVRHGPSQEGGSP